MPRRPGLEDRKAPLRRKRAVNLSADAALVAAAQAAGINLSQVFEDALREATKAARSADWRRENAAFLSAYEAFLDRHGLWSDEFRRW